MSNEVDSELSARDMRVSDQTYWTWQSYAIAAGLLLACVIFGPIVGLIGTKMLGEEFIKLCLQLLAVGTVGGLAKYELDRRRAQAEFRTEVLAHLTDAHGGLYAVRRALGLALAENDATLVRKGVFTVMDVRSELGNIGHSVRLRGDEGERIVRYNIKRIRHYLEAVIQETMQGEVARLSLEGNSDGGERTLLEAFVAGWDNESNEVEGPLGYRQGFKAPYLWAKHAADPTFVFSPSQRKTMRLIDGRTDPDASPS